jgi:hypothetical protein
MLGRLPRIAAVEVVVHESHRLHEGVDGSRTDEPPAAPLEVLRELPRFRCLGHLEESVPGQPARSGVGLRLAAPDVGGERALFLHELDGPRGVVDRRLDLAAVADDPGVAQKSLDISLAEARDLLEVEARERLPEVLALAQNRQPREAGLEAFEAELLEEPPVVVDRKAPLVVVVRAVFRR